MTQTIDQQNALVKHFQAFLETDFSGNPEWLKKRRQDARQIFIERGFPTSQLEEWRFTSLKKINNVVFEQRPLEASSVPEESLDAFRYGLPKSHRIVLLNGRYCKELSKLEEVPSEVEVLPMAVALQQDHAVIKEYLTRIVENGSNPFAALNSALFQDGVFIHIPDNVELEVPIHVVLMTGGSQSGWVASFPRTLLVAGKKSKATIIETHLGHSAEDHYLSVPVFEAFTHDDANIDHYRILKDSRHAVNLGFQHTETRERTNFRSHAFFFGGDLARMDIGANLNGPNGVTTLNGLMVLDGNQHSDIFMQVNHNQPDNNSFEVYKGVLNDNARGVFRGRIFVDKIAQKTDAKQTNSNLLLSENAQINTMPQLEIFADDVKCTHGATVGELDENALFYLKSRGVKANEARNLLINAFANDIIENVEIEPLKESLQELLNEKLPR